MVALNKVLIAGRLTREPELRRTPNGISVTDLLIALDREFTTLGGDERQEVFFVDVVVWGRQAGKLCSTARLLVAGLRRRTLAIRCMAWQRWGRTLQIARRGRTCPVPGKKDAAMKDCLILYPLWHSRITLSSLYIR